MKRFLIIFSVLAVFCLLVSGAIAITYLTINPPTTQTPTLTIVATETATPPVLPTATEAPIFISDEFKGVVSALGHDPLQGQIVESVGEPIALNLEQVPGDQGTFDKFPFTNQYNDLIFHADIEWGDEDDQCIVSFHTGEEMSYELQIRRSGELASMTWLKGHIKSDYSVISTQNIKTGPDDINKFVLDVQGNQHKVYINDLQSLVHMYTKDNYPSGIVWVGAYSPNGTNASDEPTCTFKNVWIWAPNSP